MPPWREWSGSGAVTRGATCREIRQAAFFRSLRPAITYAAKVSWDATIDRNGRRAKELNRAGLPMRDLREAAMEHGEKFSFRASETLTLAGRKAKRSIERPR